ncbi:aminoglycoside phosphotransferase family protein [Bacillus sp. Marseille-Q1617]|uniref:aminoglycoside phosphotransferase family protein n=1 Tax=Bacillus sp. Marseille-Q1617 TaxID=2736887 RepID=UPI00158D0216|nr:aminoglycoside phosphotransferase family protein [Bacillus sp. Marseille-Q1617]
MIPGYFHSKMITMYGESGAAWIDQAEQTILILKERFNLTYGEPFSLSYNFVVPAVLHDGTSVVLKTGYPNKDFSNEFHALREFSGDAMVKMIDSDQETGWMLLSHVKPGSPLHSLGNEMEQLKIFASIARSLWHKPSTSHSFPDVEAWSEGISRYKSRFKDGNGPLPEKMISKAESLFRRLLGSPQDRYLLHGDLHHENILYSEAAGWTAIDPKGLIGEREYDCIQYTLNHWKDHENPYELLKFRTLTLSSLLSLSYEKLIAYGFCHSVLSACWCTEDGGDCWQNGAAIAEMYERLMNENKAGSP